MLIRVAFPFETVAHVLSCANFAVSFSFFSRLTIEMQVLPSIHDLAMELVVLFNINVSVICSGTHWVPLNILSKQWLCDSKINAAKVDHKGPQSFTQ